MRLIGNFMNNETSATVVAEQAEADKPVLANVETTEQAAIETPEPAQETEQEKAAKHQAKLDRRFANLTRKASAAEARAEALERLLYDKNPQQQQGNDDSTDAESVEHRVIEKVRQEFEAKAYIEKTENLFKKAGVSREEFSENIPVLSTEAAQTIIESDIAPKIIKYLNENPEEAERIADLPKSRHGAEIGKLEIKLSATPVVKKSGAPAPITPISGGKPKTDTYHEGMTQAEYEEWRNRTSKKR